MKDHEMSVRRWRWLSRWAVGLGIAALATVGVTAVSPAAAQATEICPIQPFSCYPTDDPDGTYASELIDSAQGFSSSSIEEAVVNARANALAECKRRANLAHATEPKIHGGEGEAYPVIGGWRAALRNIECRYRVV